MFEALSERRRKINVRWMFSQAQRLSNATNGLGGSAPGGKRHPGSDGCEEQGHREEKTTRHKRVQLLRIIILLGLPRKFLRHTPAARTIRGTLATTAPCAPGTYVRNLRNGTRWNSEYLKQLSPFLLTKEFTPLWSSRLHSSALHS